MTQTKISIPVFCINLDRRPERWTFFSKQPGLTGTDVKRHSATDGQTLSAQDARISPETRRRILTKRRRAHGEINTLGAIGCTLSHIAVWDRFLKEYPEAEFAIVLEDDAAVPKGAFAFIETWAPQMPTEADIWILGYKAYNTELTHVKEPWLSPTSFWGTSAYVIRKSAISRVKGEIFPIESHLDRYFCSQQALGRLNLVVHPHLRFANLMSGTDIQTEKCDLCNLPDSFQDEGLTVTNKYMVYGLFAYAFAITLFLGLTRNGRSS
jgi:GR25 family glycosyltransferase involved in LPS biosynthesis